MIEAIRKMNRFSLLNASPKTFRSDWWLLLASLCCLAIFDVSSAYPETTLRYKLISQPQILPFGGRIEIPYILDTYDVDNDEADDFAVSAMTVVTNTKDLSKNKFIHSFLIDNKATEREFGVIDLGEAGLTQRAWSGKFFRLTDNGPLYLALGRNGELGLNFKGERMSIFEVTKADKSLGAHNVYVIDDPAKTASVDICDIDGNGNKELYVNNVNPPFISTITRQRPRMIIYDGKKFTAVAPEKWLWGMNVAGAHNNIAFADVNGDGRCDLLASFEAWKVSDGSGGYTNAGAFSNSYILLNSGDGFRGGEIDLPNPPFGKFNAAFSMATTNIDGKQLVALDSSEFPGPHIGFSKFKLQMFVLRDHELVEVTRDMLVGTISNEIGNESVIKFFDIDGDGDKDIYLTRYDRTIDIYLYRWGRFVLQRLSLPLPRRDKAVAFLRTPRSRCADLAVVDRGGRLYHFRCQLK